MPIYYSTCHFRTTASSNNPNYIKTRFVLFSRNSKQKRPFAILLHKWCHISRLHIFQLMFFTLRLPAFQLHNFNPIICFSKIGISTPILIQVLISTFVNLFIFNINKYIDLFAYIYRYHLLLPHGVYSFICIHFFSVFKLDLVLFRAPNRKQNSKKHVCNYQFLGIENNTLMFHCYINLLASISWSELELSLDVQKTLLECILNISIWC